MQQVEGATVEVKGKVAYVPQAAFIYNASIRDNVLFGLPYEASRYEYAVEAAALVQDLAQMPGWEPTPTPNLELMTCCSATQPCSQVVGFLGSAVLLPVSGVHPTLRA